MADDHSPFDVYADQFTVTITPFGANLSFSVREPHPSPSQVPQSQDLGTVRTSVEHLKTMVVVIRRQIMAAESEVGLKVEVANVVLNQLKISPEDWESFWRSE